MRKQNRFCAAAVASVLVASASLLPVCAEDSKSANDSGLAAFSRGEHPIALQMLSRAAELAKKEGNWKRFANIQESLAAVYTISGKPADASKAKALASDVRKKLESGINPGGAQPHAPFLPATYAPGSGGYDGAVQIGGPGGVLPTRQGFDANSAALSLEQRRALEKAQRENEEWMNKQQEKNALDLMKSSEHAVHGSSYMNRYNTGSNSTTGNTDTSYMSRYSPTSSTTTSSTPSASNVINHSANPSASYMSRYNK